MKKKSFSIKLKIIPNSPIHSSIFLAKIKLWRKNELLLNANFSIYFTKLTLKYFRLQSPFLFGQSPMVNACFDFHGHFWCGAGGA